MLNKMIILATEKHRGQYDKAGVAYIAHPLAVMTYAIERFGGTNEELLAIAVGHDLVEDTDVTASYLRAEFGDRVTNGILALSKYTGQTYNEYRAAVKSNYDAVRVKLCDLRHNTREDRGPTNPSRTEKYEKLKLELEQALSEMVLADVYSNTASK